MTTYALTITVYENNRLASISSPELVSRIEELWSPTYQSTRTFRVIDDDDEGLLLVYRDAVSGMDAPIPEEWLSKTIRVGVKTDLKLVGDRIPLTPTLHVAFHPE